MRELRTVSGVVLKLWVREVAKILGTTTRTIAVAAGSSVVVMLLFGLALALIAGAQLGSAISPELRLSLVRTSFAAAAMTAGIVAVVLCLAAAIVAGSGQWPEPGSVPVRSYLFLVLSGLATGASWLCYFRALKLGDAARVAPIDKLSVVFVEILGTLLLGERLSAEGWLGVALIAAGAILLAVRG